MKLSAYTFGMGKATKKVYPTCECGGVLVQAWVKDKMLLPTGAFKMIHLNKSKCSRCGLIQ